MFEVCVEVHAPVRVHEGNIRSQASLDHGACRFDGVVTAGDLRGEPLVQRLGT
jgi:hypothetical protein